ncbi:R2-like ligand-binding oxidase [Alicyclobacillus tolerans]|uniref:R2-like ligand-binding oxidase n=1 Tax=Alicyclobacillus tolerans TaxID=90970 RepID=UPI003B7EDB7A
MRIYQTVTKKGLDHASLPMRLYHKAKKIGIWDPRDIDMEKDREDWLTFSESEQRVILRLCTLFQAGEEAVTRDLLPLIRAISLEGRLEEEMYLTTFLWEEAKHTEVFRRFFDDIARVREDFSEQIGPSYEAIFSKYLPESMERLIHDPSPAAQAEASVTYNMVVEGILAETGYYAFHNILEKNGKMPGLLRAIVYLQKDESRHIGYGTYLLSRLIAEDDRIWDVIQTRIQLLVPFAVGVVNELFSDRETESAHAGVEPPFPLDKNDYIQYAMSQFQRRMNVLQRARGQSPDEIYQLSEATVGIEE